MGEGRADTVRLIGALWGVKLPEVPAIVTVDAPVVAELLADRVSVLEPVVVVGLNDAMTPLGRPEAAKVTPAAKPFAGFTVIVLEAVIP